jgi:uncharacterized protein (TIGR02646 family)
MKYINKEKLEESKAAATALHHWRDTYRKNGKNFKELCETLSPADAFNLIKENAQLRDRVKSALENEQGGICCYCGRELTSPNVLEHFLAKSGDKFKRTYDYHNLLVACDGDKSSGDARKFRTSKSIETSWNEIVERINRQYGCYLTVDELKKMNFEIAEKVTLEPKTLLRIEPSPQHCDVMKGNHDLSINPTVLPDCWDRFEYKGDGEIEGKDKDENAQKAIQILNLKAAVLKKDRSDAWLGFSNSLESEIGDLIEALGGTLNRKEAIQFLLNLELTNDKTYHLCVVKRAFLKEQVEELT